MRFETADASSRQSLQRAGARRRNGPVITQTSRGAVHARSASLLGGGPSRSTSHKMTDPPATYGPPMPPACSPLMIPTDNASRRRPADVTGLWMVAACGTLREAVVVSHTSDQRLIRRQRRARWSMAQRDRSCESDNRAACETPPRGRLGRRQCAYEGSTAMRRMSVNRRAIASRVNFSCTRTRAALPSRTRRSALSTSRSIESANNPESLVGQRSPL